MGIPGSGSGGGQAAHWSKGYSYPKGTTTIKCKEFGVPCEVVCIIN